MSLTKILRKGTIMQNTVHGVDDLIAELEAEYTVLRTLDESTEVASITLWKCTMAPTIGTICCKTN